MALIKCPECGTEVSDKARNCSKCSFPIENLRTDGEIRIKMISKEDEKTIRTYSTGKKMKYVIRNAETGDELWRGTGVDIARFYLDKQTEVEIASKGFGYSVYGRIKINPQKSLTYQLHENPKNPKNPMLHILSGRLIPLKMEATLSEIDNITN